MENANSTTQGKVTVRKPRIGAKIRHANFQVLHYRQNLDPIVSG